MTTQSSQVMYENTQISLIKMIFLLSLMLISCSIFAMLFSYSNEDAAWVNSGAVTSDSYHNIFGATGAYIADVMLTAIGRAAYLVPLGGVYLAFRLWREEFIHIDTLVFRLLGLACGVMAVSVILAVHNASPINSVAISGGGVLGQFFVTTLSQIFSVKLLLFAAFVFLFLCFLLFANIGPVRLIDSIGSLILGQKLDAEETSASAEISLPKFDFKNSKIGSRFFGDEKPSSEEASEALQAKLKAVNKIDGETGFNDYDLSASSISEPAMPRKVSNGNESSFFDKNVHTREKVEQFDSMEVDLIPETPKLQPTITQPYYKKSHASALSDSKHQVTDNASMLDEFPQSDYEHSGSKFQEKPVSDNKKQTLGDLTSLLKPSSFRKPKKTPQLTEPTESNSELDLGASLITGNDTQQATERAETVAKKEPSLLSKAFGKKTPEAKDILNNANQVEATATVGTGSESIDDINAQIEASHQFSKHNDNSLDAQVYRNDNAYARDENPAETFSQPAAPMREESAEFRLSVANSRKPVDPEIQRKIVSDILADSERQSKLRQAPLQPKAVSQTKPFENEVAQTVSDLSKAQEYENEVQMIRSTREEKQESTSSLSIFPNKSQSKSLELEENIIEQFNADEKLPKSDFVSQLNLQAEKVLDSAPTTPPLLRTEVSEVPVKTATIEPSKNDGYQNEVAPKAEPQNELIRNISTPSAKNIEKIHPSVSAFESSKSTRTVSSISPAAPVVSSDHTKPIDVASSNSAIKVNIGQAYEATQKATQVPIAPSHHELPSVELLDEPSALNAAYTEEDLREMAVTLETTCKQFKLDVTVMNISPGPVITRFEMDLAPGVQAKKISALSNDLARALAVSSVRVEEVITGSSYIGLEVPNMSRQTVYIKEIFKSKEFQDSKSPLTVALGTDISGQPVVADLKKMPHLLVAGTTGSGKSVSVNTMLLSMLYKATPRDLRMIMVDPKMLEMSMYEDIPHLLTPVITDMQDAENALTWAVAEMERRYKLMAAMKIRKIESFNEIIDEAEARGEGVKDPIWEPNEAVGYTHHPNLERLPYIVIIIDELADMMMVVGKDVEKLIARLTQKARAAGIHLIIATQRPSTDVLTGLIKANVPTRIAFQVSSGTDSKVIIDTPGAQNLLGNGDMLYVPAGSSHPTRLHGAFVNDQETDRITDFLRSTGEPDYINSITKVQSPEDLGAFGAADAEKSTSECDDPLYSEAVEIVLTTGKASISSVQRQLRIGYNRAARMIEQMQADGIVSEPQNGVRKVLR